ncbi:MAG: hypothetical protein B7Z55_16515 [Planctomycetales bacterium 12-60-4]|nr:MAG: hypothetical protein B7Z55_16515 [Planctomycetales bacterium 12-60-4]
MSGITYGMAASRAARLRCPRCGEGRLFRGLLTMYPHCSECGFVYQRDPGYFLGSTYINYGFTSLTMTVLYVVLHFGYGLSNQVLAGPLLTYCTVVPLIMFRYARAWWLAMDSFMDTTGFQEPRAAAPTPGDAHQQKS